METEEKWVKSACDMCLHHCGIMVRVKNGVVVEIEGDETNADNMGKLCPKGHAGIMKLYDPYRFKHPVQRTNPKKGLNENPEWEKISWKEAFDIIGERLRKLREEDPRKLLPSIGDFQRLYNWAWPAAFGSPNMFTTVGLYCGGAYHPINGITHSAFAAINDYNYCNYWIQIGSGDGFSSHLHLAGSIKRMADARMRGMKLVVVEPRLSPAAAKADEWIPIRPGTDRAFVLAMAYVLIHELGQYDAEFLKRKTNAPYLVGSDGYFVRDENSCTLIYDPVDKKIKPYNDPSIKDYALEGVYKFNGADVKPAFQVLKDKIAEYTPEWAEKITTVPSETIRRIAKEFVTEARIGSTIVLNGKQYPYRPAAVNYYRGAQSHLHGTMDNQAYKLINMLVGNIDVPGGHLGVPLYHHTIKDLVKPGPDGCIQPEPHQLHPPFPFKYPPDSTQLMEWFPIGVDPGHLNTETVLNPDKFGLNYIPDTMFLYHTNPLWNMPGTDKVIQVFQKMDFIFALDIWENESTKWADIILPDHTYLEGWTLTIVEAPMVTGHVLRQPVIEPLYDTMDATDILIELADRGEFLDAWNETLNFVLGLIDKPEYMLEPDKKYTAEEIFDRVAKALYGEDRDLEWFKEHGNTMREMTPEELYDPYGDLRLHFYMEIIKKEGDELKSNLEKHGVDWWDTSFYRPLPEWVDSPLHTEKDYDLYAITYKSTQQIFAMSAVNPWLTDISVKDPMQGNIVINRRTGERKGLKDGDWVIVKSLFGEVRGRIKLIEGIHPEVVGFPNDISRFLEGHPILDRIESKGAHYNRLLPSSLEWTDRASGVFETAVRVSIEKA
jgi:anaerobic selenocysteine-containing dehydrogenase